MIAKKLYTDVRGAVMIEGVVVFPVFVLILAVTVYFYRAYKAKITLNLRARSCAWGYAMAGCKDSQTMPDCPIDTLSGGPGDVDTALRREAQQTSGEKNLLRKGLNQAKASGLNLLGLGGGVVARPNLLFSRPVILGGGKVSIGGDYAMSCNEVHRTPSSIAIATYCAVSSRLPGCPRK